MVHRHAPPSRTLRLPKPVPRVLARNTPSAGHANADFKGLRQKNLKQRCVPGPLAQPRHHPSKRPGPKPGLRSAFSLLLYFLCGRSEGVRVVTTPAGVTEGAAPGLAQDIDKAPKLCGTPIPQVSPVHNMFTRSVKRSFKRACRRAICQGSARYRGRTLTAAQVPADLASLKQTRSRPKPMPGQECGLKVLTSNTGGIGGRLYEELLYYLENSSWDIVVLQETRSGPDMEYQCGSWNVVHSGHKPGQAGVLIALRKSLAKSCDIQLNHIIAGRLLQVRFPLRDGRHVHVLGLYQKAWSSSDKAILDKRQEVWFKLDQCLQSIAWRDTLLLAGDFNTQLVAAPPGIGPGLQAQTQIHASDHTELARLIEVHSLVVLNSWSSKSQTKHTYQFGSQRSQIDFILTRHRDATPTARASKTLCNFHVGASRHSGPHHLPVGALVPFCPPPWQSSHLQRRPSARANAEAVASAATGFPSAEQQSQINSMREVVVRGLPLCTGTDGAHRLRSLVAEACRRFFPAPTAPPMTPKAWETSTVTDGIRAMWQARKKMRSCRTVSLSSLFSAWHACASYSKLHEAHKRRCRNFKQERLMALVTEAETCAQHHDQRGLYKIINKLAPKQYRRRMQLRGESGELLSPSQ